MNIFKSEPSSLDEVRASLNQDDSMDFIALMEKHHDFLEQSIDVIMSKDAEPTEKQMHLSRFLHLVAMHAKAEEETLYIGLKRASEKLARVEGLLAQDEHDLADQLADELKDMGCETQWSEEIEAKAQVIAGLVQNHIKEEEHEIFKTARKDIPAEQLENLREEYIEKCRVYLDDELGSVFIDPSITRDQNASF